MSYNITVSRKNGKGCIVTGNISAFYAFRIKIIDMLKEIRPDIYEIICGGYYGNIRIYDLERDDYIYLYNMILNHIEDEDVTEKWFWLEIIKYMEDDDRLTK